MYPHKNGIVALIATSLYDTNEFFPPESETEFFRISVSYFQPDYFISSQFSSYIEDCWVGYGKNRICAANLEFMSCLGSGWAANLASLFSRIFDPSF